VQHPGEWPWCSYTEWRSGRQRHQILARQSLLQLLGYADDGDFRRDQETAIAAALGRGGGQREGFWSESVAVGSEQFVRQIATTVEHRADLQFAEHRASDGQAIWSVRESRPRYLQEAGRISRYQGAAWQEMPRN
jgi:putative transposase